MILFISLRIRSMKIGGLWHLVYSSSNAPPCVAEKRRMHVALLNFDNLLEISNNKHGRASGIMSG